MNTPARGVSHHRREPLLENWYICATPPAGAVQSVPPVACAWTSIVRLAPAAAALRDLKQWSIDEPARHFDAQDWWFRLAFDAPEESTTERTILGFDGLATVAEVWLNGKALLTSTNMFVAHECDVSNTLKAKDNELVIRFLALDAQLAVRRKRPRWRAPMIEHQQLRWFRTTLLGRTPGWSPPAAVVGPWRDIWLERRSLLDVRRIALQASVQGSVGVVKCHLEAVALDSRAVESVYLQLERHSLVVTHQMSRSAAVDDFAGELRINDADLWWPHTHGEPAQGHSRPMKTALPLPKSSRARTPPMRNGSATCR